MRRIPTDIFQIERVNGFVCLNFSPSYKHLYNKYYHSFIDMPYKDLRTALNMAMMCVTRQHDDAERLREKMLCSYNPFNVASLTTTIADIKAMEAEILRLEEFLLKNY